MCFSPTAAVSTPLLFFLLLFFAQGPQHGSRWPLDEASIQKRGDPSRRAVECDAGPSCSAAPTDLELSRWQGRNFFSHLNSSQQDQQHAGPQEKERERERGRGISFQDSQAIDTRVHVMRQKALRLAGLGQTGRLSLALSPLGLFLSGLRDFVVCCMDSRHHDILGPSRDGQVQSEKAMDGRTTKLDGKRLEEGCVWGHLGTGIIEGQQRAKEDLVCGHVKNRHLYLHLAAATRGHDWTNSVLFLDQTCSRSEGGVPG